MDQTKHHQNKKSLTQLFMNAQFLKRVITKLLLSLSVFSLLFSHSTWLYELLINFNFFSSLPIKLVSHTLDKNYIFLLCNLLVLLAKYSGLLSCSSSSSKHDNNTVNEYYTYKNFQDYSRPEMFVMMEQGHQLPLLGKEEEESDHQSSNAQNEHEHIEQVITIDEHENTIDDHDHQKKFMVEEDHKSQGEQEEEEEFEEKQAFAEEEEEEEEEFNEEQAGWMFWEEIEEKEDEEKGGNGRLSTEELNKKFDEFIRKMKEELRIEAQRQLVMV